MTEQEIVNVLKDNKRNGIAFRFLPNEVIQFALKHKENLKFHDSEGFWVDTECQHKEGYGISIHEIVCLAEDFELKKESKGGWVEFDIDNDGTFYINSLTVLWFNWQHVLSDSYGKKNGFIAFGGWQYENGDCWFTQPQTIDKNGSYCCGYKDDDKPAIPVKIRFWKGDKING